MIGRHALPAASLGALCLLISPRAIAQTTPTCASLSGPIYLAGSSAIKPLLQAMAGSLSPTTTLVYQSQGSCTGVTAIAGADGGAGVPITGTGSYWPAGSTTPSSCTLDAAGTAVDVGLSDVFPETCLKDGFLGSITSLPANVGDYFGPEQAMSFVVPSASTNTAITADEAYFMFGWGDNDQLLPWNNHLYFFVRNNASGTQNILAYTIDPVDEPNFVNNYWAAKSAGIDSGSSGNVVKNIQAALGMAVPPDMIIGILSTATADAQGPSSTTPLNQLAFRAPGQVHGYLADSQLGAHDKINVRQGRFVPFGPEHMVALKDATGNPSASAKYFIDLVQGIPTTPLAPFTIEDLIITTGFIPDCAMQVSRTAEGGPLSMYAPAAPCGCYFEFKATGATTCATCTGTGQGTCTGTGQQCRHGYCEAY
jgi:hypothetical protein